MYGTKGDVYTFMQIGVHRALGRWVEGELEGAEADWLPGDAGIDLLCGWSRCDHDSNVHSSHRRRQLMRV